MANSLREENAEFKPDVDLEQDGLHQVIPAESTLQSSTPMTKPIFRISFFLIFVTILQ